MQTLAQITVAPAVSDAANFSLAMQPALGRSNTVFVAPALTYNPATKVLTLPGSANLGSITATGTVGIGTTTVSSGNVVSVYGGNIFVAGTLRIANSATQFSGIQFADGTILTSAISGATGGGSDRIFWQNGTTVNNSYTIPANTNAGTFGPVTIASTATITISNNSVWTIV
jgi:hypothetical protein